MKHMSSPRIAIVSANTLTAIGLESLLARMMPGVEVHLFDGTAALRDAGTEDFVHFFVSVDALMSDVPFYHGHVRRTVVLTTGDTALVPPDFHAVNVAQSEKEMLRDILKLSSGGHHAHASRAAACPSTHQVRETPLTRREAEVLRLIVMGCINKEIADRLCVSLTTVISHRKNLMEKLGIKTVSGLTIFAVMHGIVSIDEL